MTLIAFAKKVDQPTKGQIQDTIQKLGYDFQILSGLEEPIDQDGIECSINGHQAYFETYVDTADDAVTEHEAYWIKPDISNHDTAISFIWGADFGAGACIGLISIALIDHCSALVYYMDDQMKYTRDSLQAEIQQFLVELNKQSIRNSNQQDSVNPKLTNTQTKKTFWDKLNNIFK